MQPLSGVQLDRQQLQVASTQALERLPSGCPLFGRQ
jgi:hypothetical protein